MEAKETQDAQFKYRAFISYSHRDKKWGDWLHRSLETYRVPKALAGKSARNGIVPRRVYPVFRDREELPTSADLGGNIREALGASRCLVVICSPHSARSHWVNEEIRAFKGLGREGNVLALIIGGEPNASDGKPPFTAEDECFPPALRFKDGPGGAPGTERCEPIAADARKGRDGRGNAKLKLLAGILGVNYDALKQRERERLRRRRLAAATLVLAICAALVATWQWQEAAKRKQALLFADQERHKAADLWEEHGRGELLSGNVPQALAWFAPACAINPTKASLQAMTARALDLFSELAGSLGHDTSVKSAQLSPDGNSVVTTSLESFTRIWRTSDGKLTQTFSEPHGDTQWAAFSPDGKLIVTAGYAAPCRLRDAATGAVIRTLGDENGNYLLAAFSPDGQKVLAAAGNSVNVWNAADGKPLYSLTGHKGAIVDALFSHDSNTILTRGEDKTARTWNAQNGAPELNLASSEMFGFSSAQFNPDDTKIIVTESKSVTTIWNAATGAQAATLAEPDKQASIYAEFSPDGAFIATGRVAGSATLWDAGSGKPLAQLYCKGGLVNPVHFSRDGTMAVTVNGADVRTWDIPSGKLRGCFLLHSLLVRTASFTRDGRYLLTAGDDNTARIWNTDVHNAPSLIPEPNNWLGIRNICTSPDGGRIAVSDKNGGVSICSVPDGKILFTPAPSGRLSLSAVFTPDGRTLATAGNLGLVQLWNISDGKMTREFPTAQDTVFEGDLIAVSPDGRYLAAAGRCLSDAANQGVVNIYDMAKGERVASQRTPNSSILALQFDAQGRRIVVLSRNNILDTVQPGSVLVWDFTASAPARPVGTHGAAIVSASFSPDGSRILTASEDTTAKLWDSGNGGLLATLAGHGSGLICARFSRDGSRIITAGKDQKATIWDAASGKLLCTLEEPGASITSAAFSPDGAYAATVFSNGVPVIWDAQSGKPLFMFPEILRFWNDVSFTQAHGDLVAMTVTGGACMWPMPRLQLSPAELADYVKAHVPFTIKGGVLVPAAIGP